MTSDSESESVDLQDILVQNKVNDCEKTPETISPSHKTLRHRILKCAAKNGNWVELAARLGVKYRTAYNWVRCRRHNCPPPRKGAYKLLSSRDIDTLLEWIQDDPTLTIKQLQAKIFQEFDGINVCKQTISNYLLERQFQVKKVGHPILSMTEEETAIATTKYIHHITKATQSRKTIIWLAVAHFNIVCNKTQDEPEVEIREAIALPSHTNPNIHLIGAMTHSGMLKITNKANYFTDQNVVTWVKDLLDTYKSQGMPHRGIAIVCDIKKPIRMNLQALINRRYPQIQLIRLGPYASALNPMEILWSKVKSNIKCNVRQCMISGSVSKEQSSLYIQNFIHHTIISLTESDGERASQHVTIDF